MKIPDKFKIFEGMSMINLKTYLVGP